MSEITSWNVEKINCTVVIPTYNRPAYLKRILSYYHKYGKNLPVLIADSSSEDNKTLNRGTVNSFTGAFFTYLDKYGPSTDPWDKVHDAFQQVSTEYCVLCADDDFITPSGIQEAAAFLDINPNFNIAHGHYLGFQLEIVPGSEPKFCWYKRYVYQSINHPEPQDRLSYLLSNASAAVPTMHAVFRTNLQKMIYAEVVRSTSDSRFAEILYESLVIIYGKIKYLEILYEARDNTSSHTVTDSLPDFVKEGSYNKKYLKFSNSLANHLSKQSGIGLAESQKIVDTAVSVYMEKKYFPKTDKIATMSTMSKIIQKVVQLNLPNWLYSSLRRLYRSYKYLLQSPTENAYDSFIYTVDAPASKYYHDFNQIRSQVLSSAGDKYLIE